MPEPRYRYVVEVKGPSGKALTQLKTEDAEEALTHFFQIIDDAEEDGTITIVQSQRLLRRTAEAFASGKDGVGFILGPNVVGLHRIATT